MVERTKVQKLRRAARKTAHISRVVNETVAFWSRVAGAFIVSGIVICALLSPIVIYLLFQLTP